VQHKDHPGKVTAPASKAIQENMPGKGISLPAVSPVQKEPGTGGVVQMTREQATIYLGKLPLPPFARDQSVPDVVANSKVMEGIRYRLLHINNNGLMPGHPDYLPFIKDHFEDFSADDISEAVVEAEEYLASLTEKESDTRSEEKNEELKVPPEKPIGPEDIDLKKKKITLIGTRHDNQEKDRSEEIRDNIAPGASVILEYPPHPTGGKSYGEHDISKVQDPVQTGLANYAALHEHDKGFTTIGADGRKAYKGTELHSLSLRGKKEDEYQFSRTNEVLHDEMIMMAGSALVENFLSAEGGDLGAVLGAAQALVVYTNIDMKHVLANVQIRLRQLLPQLQPSDKASIGQAVMKKVLSDLKQTNDGYEGRAIDYSKAEKLPDLIKLTNREKISAYLDGICNLLLFTEVVANSSQHVVVAFGNEHVKPLKELLNEIKSMEM
jgi:hypothetical protein